MKSIPEFATSFVGRENERSHLGRLTAGNRLVTVVGPGGVGKTRLVAEAAKGWRTRFSDEVLWLDLSAIRESQMLEQFIADQFGLRAPSATELS